MKIIHRDLKAANIFLNNENIKIGDFNVCKVIKRGGYAQTMTGTPFYISPEVLTGNQYDYKCDIWALGCIIYEMTTFKHPFNGNNIQELFLNIL